MVTDNRPNIQILTGGDAIPEGHVALVIYNCPIGEVKLESGEVQLQPCMKLTARQAMEVGMNLIHVAKIAESKPDQEI